MLTANFETVREVADRIKTQNHGAQAYLLGESAVCHARKLTPDQWIVLTDAPDWYRLPEIYGISYVRMPVLNRETVLAYASRQMLRLDGVVVDFDGRVVFDLLNGLDGVKTGELALTSQAANANEWLRSHRGDMIRIPRLTVSLGATASPLTLPNSIREAIWSGWFDFEREDLGTEEFRSTTRHELSIAFTSKHRKEIFRTLYERRVLKYFLPVLHELASASLATATHRELNVLEHVILALGSLPERASLEAALGVIFHDVGKLRTRIMVWKNRPQKPVDASVGTGATQTPPAMVREPVFPNHEYRSAEIASRVLRRLGFDEAIVEQVVDASWVHMDLRSSPTELTPERLWVILSLPEPSFQTALAVHSAEVAGRIADKDVQFAPAVDHSAEYAEERRKFLLRYPTKNRVSVRMLLEAGVLLEKEVISALYGRLDEDVHSQRFHSPEQWIAKNVVNGRLVRDHTQVVGRGVCA